MLHLIELTFIWILQASLYAAVLITVLAILRLLIRSNLPPACWCALWLLAGLRFVIPPAFTISPPTQFTPPAPVSIASPPQRSTNTVTRVVLLPPVVPVSVTPQPSRLTYRHI